MIGKYLYDLLKINARVIIPDFGAFLVKEKSGGKMEITYNDFLKFNDGLLVNKIIKTEGVNKTEATKKIKEYIAEMENTFRNGEHFKIESVGKFYKDDFNRIKFEPFKEEKTDTKKEEPKKEPVIKEEKPAVKESAKEEKVVEKPKDTEKKEEVVKDKKEEVKLTEKVTAKVTTPKPETKPIASKKPEPVKAKTTIKKSGNNTIIWVGAIVVVIAALITWGVLDYDRISGWLGGHNEETVVTPPIVTPIDTVLEDTTAQIDTNEEMIEAEPVEVEQPEPVYQGPKYYVIAGSFKVENNAINHNQRLIDAGYNSKNLGLINGFYTVSFDDFKSLNDAVKMLKMVKADQEDAWVLKH